MRRRYRRFLALVVVAVVLASAWGVHARRRRLADDSGRFYTHEEWAAYQAFLEAAATTAAAEAERKADERGPDAVRWEQEAADARRKAAAAGKSRREYEWRASLKRSRW